MELSAQAEVESALRNSSIQELRSQHASIERELASLNEQIGDLAFNNYRTYADAGRTTQHCTKIFSEMNSAVREVAAEVPALTDEIKHFFEKARKLNDEAELVKAATDRTHPLWDVLGLPAKMDLYIRTGYYDSAYALTNYGMTLQQNDIVKNPLVKLISDRMVEARSVLLEELFNKFAGPLDLAASIQVVNNVRKIPFLTGTQLRVSVLHHRDLYLDKQILDVASHPDLALKAIDIYKEVMYETVVLYTAVFPENELTKKDASIDPRWEAWPACAPSVILSDWASRNVRRLLELIERAEMKAAFDLSSVWSGLMSFGASFGRMGLDFRPSIAQHLQRLVLERFRAGVREATTRLQAVRTLNVHMAAFTGAADNYADTVPGQAPTPSPELSAWDDLAVYGNGLLEAINNMKWAASPALLAPFLSTLRDSLTASMSWLAMTFGGADGSPASPHFARAARLLGIDLIRFLNACTLYYFPYETIGRLYGSSAVTKQQYLTYADLNVRELMAACDGASAIEEVLNPILNKPRLSALDIDAVLTKKHAEEAATTPQPHPTTESTTEPSPPAATVPPPNPTTESTTEFPLPAATVPHHHHPVDTVLVAPVTEPSPPPVQVEITLPETPVESIPELEPIVPAPPVVVPEPSAVSTVVQPEIAVVQSEVTVVQPEVTIPAAHNEETTVAATPSFTLVDVTQDEEEDPAAAEGDWGWDGERTTVADTVAPTDTVPKEDEWGWGEQSSAGQTDTVEEVIPAAIPKKKDGKAD
ncbi:hypothetical protein PFISCL1PPCAC_17493 [Pristionchus fissidentatus]|uniref:Conserved oligomeric Golgi complex subunit 8 n=1 Tax=Pristionchus fissidentatus TaxID=1538716 RepID=A0AAV5W5Z0_9BILA|nr:hypothetical protein PFISCL1PPCAC_17493 [Pristionchus fissidentatus]